jgi:hypothetical protein
MIISTMYLGNDGFIPHNGRCCRLRISGARLHAARGSLRRLEVTLV